ncbi:hypothetical protein MBANPS3_004525 [Mucor bainieri]
MSRVAALSEEILMIIFSNIQSLQQLAICRLVKKAWKDPAARVMFSREIVVDSELKAIRLHRHLLMDPTKAKFITRMRFTFDANEIPLMVEELLDVAITPSIKNIGGSVKSDRFFNKLFAILDNNSRPCRINNSIGQKKLDMVKNFITFITVTLDGKAKNLKKYSKLKKLALRGWANGLQDLEDTLRSCLHLKSVKLRGLALGSLAALSMNEVKTWCQANVEKNLRCEKISIHGVCHWQALQYFLYKYPRGTIEIKGTLYEARWQDAFPDVDLWRTLMHSPQVKNITLTMPQQTRLKDVATFSEGRAEKYRFYFDENLNLMMDISK